ncbi:hypothetical protein FRC08_018851 [Ceratobasidium sp. 394]|nr:hypothetical protein FRC08_018851 [Ceratobasidium sp. 394]
MPVVRVSLLSPIQNDFVKLMKHYWQWYLLTNDAFPIETSHALELSVVYAEDALKVPRAVAKVGRQIAAYVCAKDSSIRNDFLKGVRGEVQAAYKVSSDTPAKLQELIDNQNFIFERYNPQDLSHVTGRYKHACIGTVLVRMLFPTKSRGFPIGGRFIQDLITNTPPESMHDYVDKKANHGASIGVIALAYTAILHSLHSLQYEHRLNQRTDKEKAHDKMKRKAGISFDDHTYTPAYRMFVGRLKGYKRLGKLWSYHMAPLLREYMSQYPDGIKFDTNRDQEVERNSDGE